MKDQLSHFNAEINPKGIKNNHKLSYQAVLGKLNQIEDIYTEILGAKTDWDQEIKDSVEKTRMTIMLDQCTKDPEDMYWYEKD